MLALSLIKLNIAIFLVLFLPGYFFVRAIFRKKEGLSPIEKLVFSLALSLTAVDSLMIILYRLSIPITSLSVLVSIFVFSFACYFLGKRLDKRNRHKSLNLEDPVNEQFSYSKRAILLFLFFFFFSTLIRTVYVANGALPQTTDLGHHMYWSKLITTTGQLPNYGVPDFIIGEHMVFAAVALVSGLSFVSAMPVSILLIINLFSILAVFLVVQRISEIIFGKVFAEKSSIFSLVVIGIFYAISSPGAKYVSGGVIGNIIGNFLIPLALFSFLGAIQKENSKIKQKSYSFVFFLILTTLAYTHHLSSFIFLYVFAGFIIISLLALLIHKKINLLETFALIKSKLTPFASPQNLALIFIFFVFLFFIFPLSYLNPSAIDTAVGTPIKETRIGMGLIAIAQSIGTWRFFYGLIGLLVLSFIATIGLRKKEEGLEDRLLTSLLALSWFAVIFLMSFAPKLLKVDIPTNRIANYLSLPAVALSSIGVFYILDISRRKLEKPVIAVIFLLIISTGFISGISDASDSTRDEKNPKEVAQTYKAAAYLAKKTNDQDVVLKDHIYLAGDTWIKIFLMRDYKNPLSRSLLKRYDDPTNDRETCTRDMVAQPDSEIAKQCYEETNTNYVVLKPGYDTAQFDKSDNFDKIYSSEDVAVYERISKLVSEQ